MGRLDNWVSVIANIGVIAGIFFLGFQIGLEREATTANTTQMRAEAAREAYLAIATSDAIAPIFEKMAAGQFPGPAGKLQEKFGLSGEEAIRIHFVYLALMRQAEANLRIPMTDGERAQTEAMLALGLTTPQGVWWEHAKRTFAPDFVAEVDRIAEGRQLQ